VNAQKKTDSRTISEFALPSVTEVSQNCDLTQSSFELDIAG